MSEGLFAVGARGLAAAEMTPNPWFVGCLQRWAHLCAAVESALAKLGVDNRTQPATYTLKPRGL
jgi:hypothetical protein